MEYCLDAPLEEPALTPYKQKLNALTHKLIKAQRDVDNVTSERDYILSELKGCKYIRPADLASIAQNFANHLECATGDVLFYEKKIKELQEGG